ncbi:DUF421 domain-containing protein [Sulfitobacter sp. F26169L]|mgnify:CR=1 FL=1|uniref:DUF421 domain-containing protein n=1 Tax=Sulfitobacter sp. F26169L TaxID=2996015 RepID=UPI0022609815|nr:YetF domain-containing protein [Sulfitobacter sp. F26169L]MCX7567722.1 DUF421 domain-containing protein [Sulfitobacter sp. F26169L]
MFFDHTLIDAVAKGALLSALGLCWIIVLVRFLGLRSFSKMTNFDFVMTVGMGSLLAGASQSSDWAGLVQTMTAMAALFAVQFCVAFLRHRSEAIDSVLQNEPALLMKDGEILHEALLKTRVTEGDLLAKLREANALEMSSIRAVVLETTGDVSVLHGPQVDGILLKGLGKSR